MAETLVTKLLHTRLVGGSLAPGEEAQLRVDQVLLEDYTATMACLQFETLAVDRIAVPFAVQYVDHNVLQLDWKDQDDHRYLKSMCARYGPVYSTPGNGICHYLHLERFACPGLMLAGADSHATIADAAAKFTVSPGGLEGSRLRA